MTTNAREVFSVLIPNYIKILQQEKLPTPLEALHSVVALVMEWPVDVTPPERLSLDTDKPETIQMLWPKLDVRVSTHFATVETSASKVHYDVSIQEGRLQLFAYLKRTFIDENGRNVSTLVFNQPLVKQSNEQEGELPMPSLESPDMPPPPIPVKEEGSNKKRKGVPAAEFIPMIAMVREEMETLMPRLLSVLSPTDRTTVIHRWIRLLQDSIPHRTTVQYAPDTSMPSIQKALGVFAGALLLAPECPAKTDVLEKLLEVLALPLERARNEVKRAKDAVLVRAALEQQVRDNEPAAM